jgi:hypothetical protein
MFRLMRLVCSLLLLNCFFHRLESSLFQREAQSVFLAEMTWILHKVPTRHSLRCL